MSALMLAAPVLVRAEAPSLADQRQRLAAARNQARAAQQRAEALDRHAAAERDEAVRTRAEEAAAALRIRATQAGIAAAQARLAIVDRLLRAQHARLAERQAAVTNLVAALQSMAHRPAVLSLMQPGSTADIVHVRAVLGAAAPAIQARTAGVRAEIARTRRLRAEGALALQTLRQGRAHLEDERLALVQLEARHRLRSRDYGRSALVESDRAIAYGEQARTIVDRMQAMGTAAETGQALASLPGPMPRPDAASALAITGSGVAPYRLPAPGVLVTGFGELSDTGVRARGLTFAVAPGAAVVAPAAGRVRFARAFRGYGNVVILDHGQGWTSMIAGLGPLAVRSGDQVGQGSPLARAPQGEAPHLTVELRRRGQPMDIVPLLR